MGPNPLQISEEHLANFFRYSNDLFAIDDKSGYFRLLNPAWEKVLGYSREQLMARPFIDFVHPDDKSKTIGVAEEFYQGKTLFNFKNRYIHAKGHIVYLSWTATPSDSFNYSIARDISDSEKSKKSLIDNKNKLKLIIESMDDLVFSIDRDGVLQDYHQPHKLNNLCVHSDDFVGKHYNKVLPPFIAVQLSKAIGKLKKTKKPQVVDCIFRKTGQDHVWFEAKLSATLNSENKISGYTAVARDITNRKLIEKSFRERLEELEELNKAMNQIEAENIKLKQELEKVKNSY